MGVLRTMFVEELRDLYDAEKQLTKAIPRMAKAASDGDLKQGFNKHLEQTRQQIARLEKCFELLGERARSKPCSGMKGIVEEGQEQMQQDLSRELMDAALTGAAKRVEHYEMAAYQAVIELAKALRESEVVGLLQQTLEEETQMDRQLSQMGKVLVKTAVLSDTDQGLPQRGRAAKKQQSGATGNRAQAQAKGKKAASQTASKSRGNKAGGSHLSNTTTDHEEIRRWAEDRGAHPACVRGTGGKGDTGMIRLDFPGFSGADSLEAISWDDFFEKFDENRLALVYQDHTAAGEKSNFNKLIKREQGAKTKAAR